MIVLSRKVCSPGNEGEDDSGSRECERSQIPDLNQCSYQWPCDSAFARKNVQLDEGRYLSCQP
jgi:hypothetical protein